MLSIDISHAASFLPLPYQAALRPRLERAANWLQQGGGKGSDFIGWVTLPRDYDREEYDRILAAAKTIQADSEGLIFRHVRHVTAETAEDIPWTLDGEYDPGAPVVEIGIEENGVTMLL